MTFTYETLNEILGFNIDEDPFFSEGVVLMIDGDAWSLTETCGDQLFFDPSDEIETAQKNNSFFYDRSIA